LIRRFIQLTPWCATILVLRNAAHFVAGIVDIAGPVCHLAMAVECA
jgi:hypothetical protein